MEEQYKYISTDGTTFYFSRNKPESCTFVTVEEFMKYYYNKDRCRHIYTWLSDFHQRYFSVREYVELID